MSHLKVKILKRIVATFIALIALQACEIERLPHGSMDSDTIINDSHASLESLLTGTYAQLKAWSDPMHRTGEYAGDMLIVCGSSTDAFYEFISYARTSNNYRLTQFWDSGYKAIAQASNIIEIIEEGQDEAIDNNIGEAYYVRGMMYFYLTRAFGRPYYQN